MRIAKVKVMARYIRAFFMQFCAKSTVRFCNRAVLCGFIYVAQILFIRRIWL